MLQSWFSSTRRRTALVSRLPQPTARAPRLAVERLEDRYLLNAGALDPFFGFLGQSGTALLSSAADSASATAFESDGKLVVAGTTANGSTEAPYSSFALARYNASGTLDYSFGLGGRATAFFGPNVTGPTSFSTANVASMVIQPDGKIVVTGTLGLGFSSSIAVARFTANGLLDPTFGTGGEVVTQFVNGDGSASSVTLQSDGKIVVAGQSDGSSFALLRYNTDGTLDTTFGSGGEAITRLSGGDTDAASTVTVQANGQILVAGYAMGFHGHDNFALLRYNGDGSLDSTFGTNGAVTTDFSPTGGPVVSSDARSLVVLANGTIRAAGEAGSNMALAQYTSTGVLDTSFGSAGKVTTSFGYTFAPIGDGVSFTPSDQVVVVGSTSGSTSDFAVERYNANGSVDTTFGTSGHVTTDFGGNDVATAAAVNASGTLAVVGVTSSNNGDFAVASYRSNGSPLASFGNNGKVTTDFYFSTVVATNPTFQPASSGFTLALPNGDLLVAGTIAPDGIDGEWVLARYTANGWLDPTFGQNGIVVTSFGSGTSATVSAIALGQHGKIIVVGSVLNPTGSEFAVASYNANGSPDTHFNGTGQLTIDFNGTDTASGVAVLSNGEILVVGTTFNLNVFENDFALAKITTKGVLDTMNFGSGTGKVTTDFLGNAEATGVVVMSDGHILVGGTAFDPNGYDDIAVARYTANGTLDTTFGNAGLATADFGAETTGSSIALEPNGTIVVGGTTANGTDPNGQEQNFALARFTTSGILDPNFGSGGKFSFNFNGGIDDAAAIAIQSNGEILIAGTRTDTTTFKSDFALARVNVNGTLDATFGTGGEVTTNFGGTDVASSVVITASGTIVVGGSAFGTGGGYLALADYFGNSDQWGDC